MSPYPWAPIAFILDLVFLTVLPHDGFRLDRAPQTSTTRSDGQTGTELPTNVLASRLPPVGKS